MDHDEKIRKYLRSRADVPVPDDLRWPSAADGGLSTAKPWWPLRWAGLAAAAIVVAAIIRTAAVGPAPGTTQSSTPSAGSEIPATVAGMPVLSVAQAVELIQNGDADGRAIAVAGFFAQTITRCLPARAYRGPFDDECRYVAFADDPSTATLCTGNGCHPPSGVHLEPWFMPETSGPVPGWDYPLGDDGTTPVRVVLIGHAGDARRWQCAADDQGTCDRAFVVDRVAQVDGTDIPLTAPMTTEADGQTPLSPSMTLVQLNDALPTGAEVLTAAVFRARDIWAVDPRWNLAGDDLVWILRSVDRGDASDSPTHPVTVSLVDDATGDAFDAHDLGLDQGYRPARLWTIATAQGSDCCDDRNGAFYEIRSNDGTSIHEGRIGGGVFGSGDMTTFGIGAPLVLDPATYSVTVWLANSDDGTGPRSGECTTDVALDELDDLMLEAVFPDGDQDCAFGPPSSPRLDFP